MSDKPDIHGSLTALEREGAPEPFRYGLPGSKTIVFPDPGEMDWLEAEQFLQDVAGQPNSVVLKKWLSTEDYDKIAAAKPKLWQIKGMMEEVGKHYRDIFGGPGEGDASTES